MIRFVSAVALFVGLVAIAPANPPTILVQPQYAPAYGVQYPDPSDLAAAIRDLTAEVKSLREEVARLKSTAGPVTQIAPPPRIEGLAIAERSCAKCHTSPTAAEKGGGLVLFEASGGLAALAPRDRQRAVTRVRVGSMPPPPASLSADDRKALADFLEGKSK